MPGWNIMILSWPLHIVSNGVKKLTMKTQLEKLPSIGATVEVVSFMRTKQKLPLFIILLSIIVIFGSHLGVLMRWQQSEMEVKRLKRIYTYLIVLPIC